MTVLRWRTLRGPLIATAIAGGVAVLGVLGLRAARRRGLVGGGKPGDVKVGRSTSIDLSGWKPDPTKMPTTGPLPKSRGTYTSVKGDTIAKIAATARVKAADLVAFNAAQTPPIALADPLPIGTDMEIPFAPNARMIIMLGAEAKLREAT